MEGLVDPLNVTVRMRAKKAKGIAGIGLRRLNDAELRVPLRARPNDAAGRMNHLR